MATKQNKRTGLGEPDVEGVGALFEAPKSAVPEQPKKETSAPPSTPQKQRTTTKEKDPEPEDKTVARNDMIGKVWIRYWPPGEWGLSPNHSASIA